MPPAVISEESFFFITIEGLLLREPVTCPPDLPVIEVARVMQQQGSSGVVVVDGERPVGIVTLRDLRDLIVSTGGDLAGWRARQLMKDTIITIRPQDYLFEAIFRMAKHNIHRLVVTDGDGRMVGVVTDDDLLRVKTRTPLYLSQEVESARTSAEIRAISERLQEMVRFALRAGADTRSLVQLISHFNDAFTLRLIALMDEQEGIRLPANAAYLALGSEGRGEQTLRTDQDSAIVHADELGAGDLACIERFSVRLIELLEESGVPRCPGNTMASNPEWRLSLSQWKARVEQWIFTPSVANMINFGLFQDMRTLHGDGGLELELRGHILSSVARQSLFLPHMARHICHFPPPLGWFGRLKVEAHGPHRGKVDLKKAGIFAITRGVSLLALECGELAGTTWDKLALAGGRGMISSTDTESIGEAFGHLVRMRLERQLRDIASGAPPGNHVDPLILSDRERAQLRAALRAAATLLRILRDRYKLDFISR